MFKTTPRTRRSTILASLLAWAFANPLRAQQGTSAAADLAEADLAEADRLHERSKHQWADHNSPYLAHLLQQVLALRQAWLPGSDPCVTHAAYELACVLTFRASEAGHPEEFPRAEQLLQQAIAGAQARPGHDALTVARYRSQLSGMLRLAGRDGEALAQACQVLTVQHALLPPDSIVFAGSLSSLRALAVKLGRPSDAAELGRAVMAIVEHRVGNTDPAARALELFCPAAVS